MKLRIPTLLLASLLLASCTAGTDGIFASIEREQKIVSQGGLNKYATITSMAEFSSKYFATGGRALFSRATSAVQWDKQTVGGNTDIASIGVAGTKLYAVAGGQLYESSDGTNWASLTVSPGTAYSLVPIRKGDGTSTELVLVATDGSGYPYVYLIGASGLGTSVTLPAPGSWGGGAFDPSSEVISAVNDGSSYYLLNESFLWMFNSGFGSPTVQAVSGVTGSRFSGLLYRATGTTFYLTTKSSANTGGGLYSSADAVTFTAITSNLQDSGYPVSLGMMIPNSVNSSIWIATGSGTENSSQEGYGYGEYVSSFSLTPITDSNNYTSSNIPTSSVGVLFKGSSGYFLGTVAHGLWLWDSSKKTWSQQ